MNSAAATTSMKTPSRLKRFWQERVVGLIVAQFTQGFTPQKIALTIALGFVLGIFPILGATSVLCAFAALALRLNQPVIQLVNFLVSALQLALILVFVRLGEWLVNAPPVSFSVPELMRRFQASPAQFMQDFGLTGLHGILAWLIVAPLLAMLIYHLLLPPLKKLAQLTKPHAP